MICRAAIARIINGRIKWKVKNREMVGESIEGPPHTN